MGDERTYDYTIAIRAVESQDEADWLRAKPPIHLNEFDRELPAHLARQPLKNRDWLTFFSGLPG